MKLFVEKKDPSFYKPTEDAWILRLVRDGEQLPEPDRQLGLPLSGGPKQQQQQQSPRREPSPTPQPSPLPPLNGDDGDERHAGDRAAEPGGGR